MATNTVGEFVVKKLTRRPYTSSADEGNSAANRSQGRFLRSRSNDREEHDSPNENDNDHDDEEGTEEAPAAFQPHAEHPPSQAPVVRFRLTFHSPKAPIDTTKWPMRTVRGPMDCPTEGLYDTVRSMVLENLDQDENLLRQLRKQKRVLVYYVTIPAEVCGDTVIDPIKTDHRLATLGDFVDDPSQSARLDATTHLSWRKRDKAHKNQEEHKFNTSPESELEPEDLVFERAFLDKGTDRATYTYVRLGKVPRQHLRPPGQRHQHNSNDLVCDEPAVDDWYQTQGVPVDKVLLGYYFNSHPEHLRLITVPAWKIGDLWIGNCIDDWTAHEFDPADEYLQDFEGCDSRDVLHRRARKYINEETDGAGDDEDSGIPFEPKYSLNTFDPTDYGLGANVKATDIVVRFVSHVDLDFTDDRDSAKALPWNVQFTIDSRDGAGQITARLVEVLRARSQGANTPPATKEAMLRLFKKPLEGRWKLVLWVLPRGLKKMFRFPSGEAGAEDSLTQFLDPTKAGRKGGRWSRALYVEAHLVRLKQGEDDVVFEDIVQEADSGDEGEGGTADGDGDGELVAEDEDEDGRNKGKGKGKARDVGSEAGEDGAGGGRAAGGKQDKGNGKAVQKKGIARKKK